MKKYFLFLLILCVFAGKSNAQFSFEKFISEKVSRPEPAIELNMDKMMKNAVDAKINKISIKVVNAKLKDGRIVFKSIANANLKDAEAKKLNDLLKIEITKKLGKPTKENVVDGVKNSLWKITDGTTYMLTYSGNLAMLVIMNK